MWYPHTCGAIAYLQYPSILTWHSTPGKPLATLVHVLSCSNVNNEAILIIPLQGGAVDQSMLVPFCKHCYSVSTYLRSHLAIRSHFQVVCAYLGRHLLAFWVVSAYLGSHLHTFSHGIHIPGEPFGYTATWSSQSWGAICIHFHSLGQMTL